MNGSVMSNTPHFGKPGAHASDMQTLAGSSLPLNGYTPITAASNTGQDGIDERLVRLRARVTF